jgi:hypothetical protein
VTRLLRKRRLAVAGAVLLCVLTASAYGAHRVMNRGTHRTIPLYTFAKNPAWFQAKLKQVAVTGGTIHLPAGVVPALQLLDLTPSAPIRIVGSPSTKLAGISIKRSSRIVVSGLRIVPANQPAIADIRGSRDITFRNVRFLGAHEDLGVAMQLDPDDRDITVAHAEFARCQHALACILAQGRGLTIDHVRFHDVRDADPRSGPAGPVRDVHVTSSLFTGSNKDMYFAINVRDPAQSQMPLATGVEIVNNTIVSANTAAIALADEYGKVPERSRPLVQNNILGRQKHDICDLARMRTNVVVNGDPCPGDRAGDPKLSAADRPTAASDALLGAGTVDAAPATDLAGRERADPPAVGAFELP